MLSGAVSELVLGARLVEEILAALPARTVVVPGSCTAESVRPKLAESLKTLLLQRQQVPVEVEEMLADHPLSSILTSMPGIGVRTGPLLLKIDDGTGVTVTP
ncbi:hypothetical protein AB0F85_04450 [Nocardia fluminea]|uniref:hypothetical protein n=1 Tax=Nocardia fluminea TaxID=134984 RepID=UPI0033F2AB9E